MLKRKSIGFLIKPTHRCNQNCSYCYDKINRDSILNDMSLEQLKHIVEISKDAAEEIKWIWHGGEALLMGEDWLRSAQEIIKNQLPQASTSMQTNGTLLTDSMITTLRENDINIGISYDGLRNKETRGVESFELMQKMLKANEEQKNIGVILVLDNTSINYAIDSYEYIKQNGFKQISFNPVFAKDYMSKENTIENMDNYIEKLNTVFDHWFYDKNGITERTFMSFINLIMDEDGVPCTYYRCEDRWLSVDPNGNIFPCDRYFPEKYMLGNIKDYEDITEALEHPNYITYKKEINEKRIYCLTNCELSEFCNGGCNGNSILKYGTAAKVDEEYCAIFKGLFWHIFNKIKDLSQEDMSDINPHAVDFLMKKGYRSLSFIKEVIRKKGIEDEQ